MSKHHLRKLIVAVALAVTLVAQGVSATSPVFQSPIPHPPTNDNFSSAISVASLPFDDAVVMAGATTELNEPAPCDPAPQTVWYSYTPTNSGPVRVTLSGLYDPILAIYQADGPSITDLNIIDCRFILEGSPSSSFAAVTGTTYYFQVGTHYGSGGTAQLKVEAMLPPTNDNFSDATVISETSFYQQVDASLATTEPGEPGSVCSLTTQQTIWYQFTAPENGSIYTSLSGSVPIETPLNVYRADGEGLGELSPSLGCSTWGGFSFSVETGKTYYFQAGTSGWGLSGSLNFSMSFTPPPANDNFADATAISETPFSQSVDVTAATTEAGEPLNNCFYSVQDTVWYKIVAPSNGSVYASLSGTWWGETPLSVYRADGEGFAGLSPSLGCSVQGGFSVSVEAGKTYYFQAGTFGWSSGSLDFSMSFTPAPPPPVNDNFVDAIDISETPFNQEMNVGGATTEAGEPTGSCGYAQHTAWYKFTSPANGVVNYSLSGSYAVVNAYRADGAGFGGLGWPLDCAFSWSGPSWFNVQAGKTYYFQVGTDSSSGSILTFSLSFTPAPANDDFTSAELISALPYDDNTDMFSASLEANEPTPSCGSTGRTIWYAYTPTTSGSLSQQTNGPAYTIVAVYTGSSLNALNEVGCRYRSWYDSSYLTFHVNAGTTYYFQVGTGDNATVPFHLEVAPQPVAQFGYNPSDPTIFDPISFYDGSYDPAEVGIQSQAWTFGDGASATGCCVSRRYAKDGDYNVKLTITTPDGRTASTTQTVHVKTHDVTITKFTVPQSARASQTRQLVVGLNSKRYVEVVEVQLFKSQVGGGWQLIGTLRQTVPVRPANRTTDFLFSYTFSKADAAIGKVTFKAIATIVNALDALPADNEAIALPTRVTP